MLTNDANFVARLAVAQEVAADALLGGIFLASLGVHIDSPPHAKAGRLAIELVSVTSGGNRIETNGVGSARLLGVIPLHKRAH